MHKELYDAAIKGDVSFLSNSAHDEEYFHSQTCQGNNYLHIAIEGQHDDFIEVALKSFPGQNDGIDKLLRQKNCDGNTPLHVAAEAGNIHVVLLLIQYKKGAGHDDTVEQWRVKNNEGSTPLHVALMYLNYRVAETLLSKLHIPQLVRDVNNSEETPLHVAIKYPTLGDNEELVHIVNALHENQLPSIRGLLQGTHLLPVIELLLQKDSSVACLRDTNGLTPLLRAASLEEPYDLNFIKLILDHHPQSAKVCDHSGKTILHHLNRKLSYQEAQELLGFRETQSLVNYRDCNGDTPAHVAVGKHDMNFVRILLDFSAQFLLKNHEGVSAADLLKQKIGISKDFVEGISELTGEDLIALLYFDEEYLNGKLTSEGKVFLLSRDRDDGSNILHLLTKSPKINTQTIPYMKKVLEMYPDLLWQTDHLGNTPAHSLAAESYNMLSLAKLDVFEGVVDLFEEYALKESRRRMQSLMRVGRSSPWVQQNEDGDYPLYLSLKSVGATNRMKPALILFIKHFNLIYIMRRNKRGEFPFHLLADIEEADGDDHASNIRELENLIGVSESYINRYPDGDGLTAFQRAVRSCRTYLINIYCKKAPRVVFQQFPDNKNTALHLALEKGHFHYAELYLSTARLEGGKQNQQKLLEMSNSKDVTPTDLITSLEHLPSSFEKFLWKEGLLAGTRSMYGVPTVKIDSYTGTIGVIAALLATVSFTAGFTVPGGSKDDDGTPVLLKNVAFQIFMVSNSLALCFSMMVLFCLLWIMTTQNKKESILLVDTSILLLELSFYSTLISFMMGVYVTTINITPWMAILPCALCSLLIMLMHRWFIKDYLSSFCMRSIMCYTQVKNNVKEKVLDIFKWSTQLCNGRKENNAGEESP